MAKRIMRIIKCQVNDEYVIGSGVPIGAAGSHDDVILRLEFNTMWAGLYIYATFRDALGGHPTVVLLLSPTMLVAGEDMTYDIPVPAAAKLYAGKAMLTLTGYTTEQETEDGEIRTVEDSATNTATAYFTVLPSDYAFAEDGSIDANLAQQMQAAMAEHGELVSKQLSAIQATLDADLEDHKTEVRDEMTEQDVKIDAANEQAAEAVRTANEVVARANAGEFNGRVGDKGEKGDPGSIKFLIVTELPEEDIDESAIYLVPAESPTEENHFIEYFYANGKWETILGAGINIDLDDYVKKTDAANTSIINEKTRSDRFLSPYYIDLIVKVGITTNTKTLTDEEKAAALGWLGAVKKLEPNTNNFQGAGAMPGSSVVYNGILYGVRYDGEQGSVPVGVQANPYSVPYRDSAGNFYVSEPTLAYHAANKKYVDNLFKLSRGIRGSDEVFENKCASYSATVGTALTDWLYDYGSIAQGIYSVYKYNVQGLSRVTFLGYLGGTLDMQESKRDIFMAYKDNGSCVKATNSISVTPATSGDGPFTVDIPQGVNYIYFSTKYGTDPVIWGS